MQLAENLRSARCSSSARMTKLITARARKNKRTAHMLSNARKDHSIPLYSTNEMLNVLRLVNNFMNIMMQRTANENAAYLRRIRKKDLISQK